MCHCLTRGKSSICIRPPPRQAVRTLRKASLPPDEHGLESWTILLSGTRSRFQTVAHVQDRDFSNLSVTAPETVWCCVGVRRRCALLVKPSVVRPRACGNAGGVECSGTVSNQRRHGDVRPVVVGEVRRHNTDMAANFPDIFDAALNLPDEDRASLAYRLLQSLTPPGVVSDGDERFEAELERRLADYDAGKTEASDWGEVAARLRKTLQERTSS